MAIKIYNTIKQQIEAILGKNNNRLVIAPKSLLKKDLDLSDQEITQLFCELTKILNIDFTDIEMDQAEDVEGIIKLIEYKQELELKND